MNNMIKCKACDADNDQESTFCAYCGESLVEEVPKTKKKKTGKVVIVGLMVILLSIGTGFTAYKVLNPENKLTRTYIDNYELNSLLIMEYGEGKESNSANLYFQNEGKEKQLIAKEVDFDRYIFAPKTNQVAYVDKSSNLFVTKLGEEPIEVAKQVNTNYIRFTLDEKNIIFCAYKDNSIGTYIYNIEDDSKEKLSDLEYAYVSNEYDEVSKTLYFTEENGALYKYNKEIGKEKIKKDVYDFKVLSDSLVAYQNIKNDKREYCVYYGQSDEEEEIDLSYIEMDTLSVSNNQNVIFFLGSQKGNEWGNEWGKKDLYVKIKGQEPIKFQKEVLAYEYAADIDTLYYINGDNMLYAISMPALNKKALEDSELAKQALNEVEKNKLLSDVMAISVSADGKKVVAKSEDSELTLLINGEKLKIANDVKAYDVFNNYIVYLNVDNELYVQKDIGVNDISKIVSKPEQIAQKVKDYYKATEYGKYVIYIEENGKEPIYKFMRYSEDGNIKVMLDNLDEYDAVAFNNMEHIRKLKYQDIVGKYSSEEYGFVMELDKDSNLSIYNTGVKKGDSKVSPLPLTKDEIEITAEQEQTITINNYSEYEESWEITLDDNLVFTKGLEGTYTLRSSEGEYELQLMTDEEFKQEIERQKEAEEERLRIEEERRRAEEEEIQKRSQLENLASQYYYQGVYLPSGTYIYDAPEYSSITTYYTSQSRNWSVSDYYIDYEASVIWVEIMHESLSGYSYGYEYSWVPMH